MCPKQHQILLRTKVDITEKYHSKKPIIYEN